MRIEESFRQQCREAEESFQPRVKESFRQQRHAGSTRKFQRLVNLQEETAVTGSWGPHVAAPSASLLLFHVAAPSASLLL